MHTCGRALSDVACVCVCVWVCVCVRERERERERAPGGHSGGTSDKRVDGHLPHISNTRERDTALEHNHDTVFKANDYHLLG